MNLNETGIPQQTDHSEGGKETDCCRHRSRLWSTVTLAEGEYDGDIAMTPGLSDGIDRTLKRDKGETIEENKVRYFLQPFPPPKRMIVVGAVHIAQSLVPMATLSGYDVTIVDPRQAFATEARFPGVTLQHDWPDDAMSVLDPDRRTRSRHAHT